MKRYIFAFLISFLFLGIVTEAQTKVQVVYYDEDGTLRINPSFDNPFPVKDSTGLTKLDSLIADLAVAKARLDSLANAISGSEAQVDLVGSVPAGENNIGDVDVLTLPSVTNGYTTLFNATTLDDSPTADTSAAFLIGDKRKVAFSATYDETEVGNSVSGTLTLQVSPDSTTWYPLDAIIDGNGTDAPNANIAFSADASDYFWIPAGATAKYVRAIITGTNTDVDDTLDFTLVTYWQAE